MTNGLSVLNSWLNKTPKVRCILPKGGTTVLLNYNRDIPSRELCKNLQKSTGVALLPGETLEMEGYVRLGYCAENLEKALEIFSDWLLSNRTSLQCAHKFRR